MHTSRSHSHNTPRGEGVVVRVVVDVRKGRNKMCERKRMVVVVLGVVVMVVDDGVIGRN